ncbi:MAG: iron chelate uptake ABC transporter family permease subunit, partial [Staphylococcus epidermidis]|nr:iron chelate uptake ABC transporter family permease subunit [Staphylococcus epidermidis]
FYSLLPWFIITVPIVLLLGYQLDILNLGDHVAIALGARVKILKMTLLVLAVMLAGASIAVVGGISFLGLIAPAILLTFGDGLARGIQPPLDIPVGVVIAIIGAPYFLFLLRKM